MKVNVWRGRGLGAGIYLVAADLQTGFFYDGRTGEISDHLPGAAGTVMIMMRFELCSYAEAVPEEVHLEIGRRGWEFVEAELFITS